MDPPRNPRIEVDGAPEIAGQTEARAFRTGRDCRPRRSQIGQAPNARVACGAAGKVAVLGSILSGGITPTEASGLGAAWAALLAAANRRLSLDVVRKVSADVREQSLKMRAASGAALWERDAHFSLSASVRIADSRLPPPAGTRHAADGRLSAWPATAPTTATAVPSARARECLRNATRR